MTKLADTRNKIADIEETLRKTKNELKWAKIDMFKNIYACINDEDYSLLDALKDGVVKIDMQLTPEQRKEIDKIVRPLLFTNEHLDEVLKGHAVEEQGNIMSDN